MQYAWAEAFEKAPYLPPESAFTTTRTQLPGLQVTSYLPRLDIVLYFVFSPLAINFAHENHDVDKLMTVAIGQMGSIQLLQVENTRHKTMSGLTGELSWTPGGWIRCHIVPDIRVGQTPQSDTSFISQ